MNLTLPIQQPNYKRDSRRSRAGKPGRLYPYDNCQTPSYALPPLWPYLPAGYTLWEPAAGEGYMVEALKDQGYRTLTGDLATGQDFFSYRPAGRWDAQVTNPPWSKTYRWLRRSYELGRPFALLLKVEVLGAVTAQRLFDYYGIEVILLDQRVDFKMPIKGWAGKGATFPVAWYTWGLNIGRQVSFAHITKPPKTAR